MEKLPNNGKTHLAPQRKRASFLYIFPISFPTASPNLDHISPVIFIPFHFRTRRLVSSTDIHCPVANFSSFRALARRESEKKNNEWMKDWLWGFRGDIAFLPKYLHSMNVRQYLRSLKIASCEWSIYKVNIEYRVRAGRTKIVETNFFQCFEIVI